MKPATNRRGAAASDPIIAIIRRYRRLERAAIRASDPPTKAHVTAALEAIATTPATTLDGAVAKLKWVGKGVSAGHFNIDAAVLAGAITDIRRLAKGAASG